MVEVDTFIEPFMQMVTASVTDNFTEKLVLALIHNNFGVSISPEAQSIGNKAVADLPRSTHHFMPLTTLEQYQSKQGCAGGARRKCLVCVHVFKEESNGHYYCVTCSWPTDGYVVTVCGMRSERGSRCMDWHQEHGVPHSE